LDLGFVAVILIVEGDEVRIVCEGFYRSVKDREDLKEIVRRRW
jgi:hypothetical protein